MQWINEKEGKYRDREYVIKFYEDGHRTGYVKITLDEYKRIGEDESKIECHGGVTFLEDLRDNSFLSDGYWVGFDTAHIGDKFDFEKSREIFKESRYRALYEIFSFNEGTIKTEEYVENECKHIIDQLVDSNF